MQGSVRGRYILGDVVEGDIGYRIALAAGGGGLIAASAPQHWMAPMLWERIRVATGAWRQE